MKMKTYIPILMLLVHQCSADREGYCKVVSASTLWCKNTIPQHLPDDGITRVILTEFTEAIVIYTKTFQDKGWQNVTYLVFDNFNKYYDDGQLKFGHSSLSKLKELRELHIHGVLDMNTEWLNNISFHLTVLDLSNCLDLKPIQLTTSLFQKPLVAPNLQKLNLSRAGYQAIGGVFVFDKIFWNFVSARQISDLDLSYIRVSYVDSYSFRDNCYKLENLTIKGSELIERTHTRDGDEKNDTTECGQLKYFDASDVKLTNRDRMGTCSRILPVKNLEITFNIDVIHSFRKVESVVLDGICEASDIPSSYENIIINITSKYKWYFKHVSVERNNIKIIDIRINCKTSFLESFSFAHNIIEYFYVGESTCFSIVNYLDLTDNKLHVMLKNNKEKFKNILGFSERLRFISLAKNGLQEVPSDMFVNNEKLQHIDLAENDLKQIHFEIYSLTNLRLLNLSNNVITYFDKESMNCIDEIDKKVAKRHIWLVEIRNNPFLCSLCEHLDNIIWILRKQSIAKGNLQCIDENGLKVDINDALQSHLNEICSRPVKYRRMVYSVIGATLGFLALTTIITFTFINIRRRRAARKRQAALEELLREGHDEFEFAVFLSYSSSDEEFVHEHVVGPLQCHLQKRVETVRDLVCIGDRHFRLGRGVIDETVLCLRRSSIFVAVLSNEFLVSAYCHLEFDQAVLQGKPVLLFIKGQIDKELLPPSLAEIYQRNTRVIWGEENGNYTLKTSWELVCDSLIDMMSS